MNALITRVAGGRLASLAQRPREMLSAVHCPSEVNSNHGHELNGGALPPQDGSAEEHRDHQTQAEAD
jgi:hypothetical protein